MDVETALLIDQLDGVVVDAKKFCPHAAEFAPQIDLSAIAISDPCSSCDNIGENFLCLSCGLVYCGRFVNEHMIEHNQNTGHCITMGFVDLSCWCYQCDSFLDTFVIPELRSAFTQLHLTKFGEVPSFPELCSDSKPCTPELELQVKEVNDGSSIKVPPSATCFSELELRQRIQAIALGNCVGDAVGLGTEFMSKRGAAEAYSEVFNGTKTFEYSDFVRDFHRSAWQPGDWTDDSDQMILLLDTLLGNNGKFCPHDFARRLKFWSNNGFPELGDYCGNGLGSTTAMVLRSSTFLSDPHGTALRIWEEKGRTLAPNGAIMRTSIMSVPHFHDLELVKQNTISAARVTHADPRCIASTVALSTALALMLQGTHKTMDGDYDVEAITQEAFYAGRECLRQDVSSDLSDLSDYGYNYEKACEEMEKVMWADSLESLQLDEPRKIGYTFKCLGAAFYAFRQPNPDFRSIITSIAMEAGDADTNCAPAGALLACRLGLSSIPESWLEMPNREWLLRKLDQLFTLMF